MAFLRIYRLDFLHDGPNQQIFSQKKRFNGSFIQLIFCIKIRTLGVIDLFFNFQTFVEILSLFLSYFRLKLFHQVINQKLCFRSGVFELKNFDSDPCVKNLILKSFKKNVKNKDSSRLSKWYFFVTTASISSKENPVVTRTPEEESSSQKSLLVMIGSKPC